VSRLVLIAWMCIYMVYGVVYCVVCVAGVACLPVFVALCNGGSCCNSVGCGSLLGSVCSCWYVVVGVMVPVIGLVL